MRDIIVRTIELQGSAAKPDSPVELFALDGEPSTLNPMGFGAKIEKRPLAFRKGETDENPIGLQCTATIPEFGDLQGVLDRERILSGAPSEIAFLIDFDIVSTSLSVTPVRIQGNLNTATKRLTDLRLDRRTRESTSVVNLTFLALLSAGLVYWNTNLNVDVYHQNNDLSQKLVAGVTGSFLTFLGLSMNRLRGIFGTVKDVVGFYRFPELHMPTGLHQILSSRFWTIAFVALALVSGTIVYKSWSVKPKVPNGYVLFDRVEGRSIPDGARVYSSMITSDPQRVVAVVDCPGGIPADPVPQAVLTSDSSTLKPQPIEFLIENEERTGTLPEDLISRKRFVLDETLKAPDLFCALPFNGRVTFRGMTIEHSQASDAQPAMVTVYDRLPFEAKEFKRAVQFARASHFSKIHESVVFQKRDHTVESLNNWFMNRIDERHVVATKDVVEGTLKWIKEALDQQRSKVAIERCILIQSLWDSTHERWDIPLDESQAYDLARSLGSLVRKDLGWKANRAVAETILELQIFFPDHQAVFHDEYLRAMQGFSEQTERSMVLDYIVCIAFSSAGNDSTSPQLSWLREEISSIFTWTGHGADFAGFMTGREVSRRKDPRYVDSNTLASAIEGLTERIHE